MKKRSILITFLSLILTFSVSIGLATTTTIVNAEETPVEYSMGDANLDGKVNTRDAVYIKQSVVGLVELTERQKIFSDVNGDGNVNTRDAVLIQQSIVGMGVDLGTHEHTFENGVCICGYFEPHTHNYSELKFDVNSHWHECSCGDKNGLEEHNFDSNKKCSGCDYVTTALLGTEISSNVYEISETNLFVKVPNAQTNFSFAKTINVASGATYKVYTDISCREEYCIPSYVVNDLKEENNVYYFLVSNGDEISQVYTVTVRRRPMYTVTFNTDGGSYVAPQTIEEDSLVTKPNNPTKTGYDFASWDYDFAMPITTNKTIKASWNARNDTPYRVEYYLENLENDNYSILSSATENLTGTTNSTVYADIKTFEHFTADKTSVSGVVAANGTTVLKVYYQRDEYTVTFDGNGGTLISGKEVQTVKYGGSVIAPTYEIEGHTNIAWKNNEFGSIGASFTMVAQWQINEYTIKLIYNNGDEDRIITQEFNTIIEKVNEPDRPGYTFVGWDEEIPTKMPAQNLIINANWLAIFSLYDGQNGQITGLTAHGRTLVDLVIPDKIDAMEVRSLAGLGFSDCNFNSLTIPSSITWIDIESLSDCSIVEIIVAEDNDNYKAIGGDLYSKDGTLLYYYSKGKSLEEFIIPDCVLGIRAYAFTNCEKLEKVVMGKNVNSIDYRAFYNCSSIVELVMSESLKYIGNEAFYNCTSLLKVDIFEGLTHIGENAFYHCAALKKIMVPLSVENIGVGAFYRCNSLEDITIPFIGGSKTANSGYNQVFGYIFGYFISSRSSEDGATFQYTYFGGSTSYYHYYIPTSIKNVTIIGDITHINDRAFDRCVMLRKIILPDTVTSVGENAFYACYNLNLNSDGNLEYIGSKENNFLYLAGNNYMYITTAKINENCRIIGEDAFVDCEKLESVEIPKSVRTIGVSELGHSPFEGCDSLLKVNYLGTIDEWVNIAFGNYDSNPLKYAKNLYLNNILLKEANFTATKEISKYALYSCHSLEKVVIGNTVEKIGRKAFGECINIDSLTIGEQVKNIANYAFSGCVKISEINYNAKACANLSENNHAFSYVGSETEGVKVIIGKMASKIPDYLFENSYYIKELVFEEGSTCTTIGDYAFTSCNLLTSINIPNSVLRIGSYAFYYCSSLTSVRLGGGLSYIDDGAFKNCKKIEKIILPLSINTIASRPFEGCENLEIYCEAGAKPSGWYNNWNPDNRPVYWFVENQEDVPTDGGNYWHYDENGNIAVW